MFKLYKIGYKEMPILFYGSLNPKSLYNFLKRNIEINVEISIENE